MLKEKIEIFFKRNVDEKFPKYNSLNSRELACHQKKFKKKIGCDDSGSLLDLICKIVDTSESVKGVSAANESFNFQELLSNLGIYCVRTIYINWYRFDDVDEMKIEDFCHFFDDLWYEEADDIFIYDRSFQWVVYISHYGSIMIKRF